MKSTQKLESWAFSLWLSKVFHSKKQKTNQVIWSWKESTGYTMITLGQMVLKGVNWVHNAKIRSCGLERHQLYTQWLSHQIFEVKWHFSLKIGYFNAFSRKCMKVRVSRKTFTLQEIFLVVLFIAKLLFGSFRAEFLSRKIGFFSSLFWISLRRVQKSKQKKKIEIYMKSAIGLCTIPLVV